MIISLLTDFGYQDPFVGIMKGVILEINPAAICVDITHGIQSYDIIQGAFSLLVSYRNFPKGTIFIAVIDPGVGGKREGICVKTESYFFIAPNNGVLQLALEKEKTIQAVTLTNSAYHLTPVSSTFHGRDIFAPVSAHLSLGIPISSFGPQLPLSSLAPFPAPFPACPIKKPNNISGHVLSIDHFGNIITTIQKEDFDAFDINLIDINNNVVVPYLDNDTKHDKDNAANNGINKVSISINIKGKTIKGISSRYEPCYEMKNSSNLVALWNSFGYLELARHKGNAAKFLSANVADTVEVHFATNPSIKKHPGTSI